MPSYHFERALFVVGEPDSGKSTQIRSMFRDVRLGRNGKIPREKKLQDIYRLSNERCLYLRLTSPHEAGEAIARKRGGDAPINFLEKTKEKIEANTSRLGSRWSFACALQPNARNHMPDVVETCRAFVEYFNPERTRVAFLSPDRDGRCLQEAGHLRLVDGLRRQVPSVEVLWIDARERTANGLLLADFFDFA